MKKLLLFLLILGMVSAVKAEEAKQQDLQGPIVKEQVQISKKLAQMTEKERRKLYKNRNKEVKKLVKRYHKASAEQKPLIKAQLTQIISSATDESIAWSKQRIVMEKTNLERWENKIKKQEENLAEVKARRVDEILSGEAERRHKLAKKRWKQEMKDRKKYMK